MNRQQIIEKVACPVCGAKAGERCTRRGRPRKTVHSLRVQYATGGKIEVKPRRKRPSKTSRTDFYSSWAWKKLRYEALRLCGRQCQCCGWRPGDTTHGRLVVDHIKPRSKFPQYQLDLSNLQVLCNDCNMGKSNVYEDDFRDEWEDVERDHLTTQFMGIMQ